MKYKNIKLNFLAGLLLVTLLAACNPTNNQTTTAPSDLGVVRVNLAGELTSQVSFQSGGLPSCSTEPIHLVIRLSYPDGAFYVRKIAVSELSNKNEVTFYAPPGTGVVLYVVAIRYAEDASRYFSLKSFLGAKPDYKDPNLLISGYRAEVGEIKVGVAKNLTINLSQLQPIDVDVKTEQDESGSFVAKLDGGYYKIPLQIHLPWVATDSNEFDPQGPAVLAQNGYLCLKLPSGEGITPKDCQQWDPAWLVSGWGSPAIAMTLSRTYAEEKGLVGNDVLVWITPVYNSGLNYGFRENTRFYLPASACAPIHKKTYFWVNFPRY